jgi:hypothetical protein
LSREEKGHSPYATGDFAGHRSIYGGAYVMWLDKMIQPQGDPWLLRWDLGKTDFMEPDLPPAFLYYNPWPEEKRVTVAMANKENRLYDLMRKKPLAAELMLRPFEAKVIEIRK